MSMDTFMKAYYAATPQLQQEAIKVALEVLQGRNRDKGVKQDDDCRLVTYTEAAKRLNLSRVTVYRLVRLGRLDIVPLDGVNRIRLQSVIDFASGANR